MSNQPQLLPIKLLPQQISHARAIIFVVLLALPTLMMYLGTGDANDMMEFFNLIPVREAYRDGHWLMPTLNNVARLEKPPLPVWLPAVMARVLGRDSLWVLRFPSILAGILTAVAVYGMGCLAFSKKQEDTHNVLPDRCLAMLAGILVPTLLIFNRQSRLASYDIFATAFLTCFLTCFVLFLHRICTKQRRIGSLLTCFLVFLGGFFLGLSVLSKGPVPAATVVIPVGLWLVVEGWRGRKDAESRLPMGKVLVGSLGFALVALATFMPWLIVIGATVPGAWEIWTSELVQFSTAKMATAPGGGVSADLRDPIYYYAQFFFWVVPLTPTFVAGLVLPFVKSQGEPQPSAEERSYRRLFWMIIVVGLIMLSVPSEKKSRYALQLMPVAVLLSVAVWQEFLRLRADRKLEPAAKVMLAAQALFFIVPGMAGLVASVWIGVRGGLPEALESVTGAIVAIGPLVAGVLSAGLLAAGVALWHYQFRRRFAAAAVCLAISAWLFIVLLEGAYRADPANHTSPARLPTEAAMRLVGDHPVYSLANGDIRPWLPTLFYANRLIDQRSLGELVAIANEKRDVPMYWMAADQILEKHKNGEYREFPLAKFSAARDAFERATGRHGEILATWVDEGRRTNLILFAPPQR